MTLGGLALAVGILVDEATVAIENIHTHLARGGSVARAVLDASGEVVVPRLLAMLSVVAVFVPSFFMTGVSRSLFVPLSLAVGFSMIASFLLSSTLVPVLSVWLLGRHHAGPQPSDRAQVRLGRSPAGSSGRDAAAARAGALAAGHRLRGRHAGGRRARRRSASDARSFRPAASASSSSDSARPLARSSSRPNGSRPTCSTRSRARPARTTSTSRSATSACSRRRTRSTRSFCGPAARTKACCRWRSGRTRASGSTDFEETLRGAFRSAFPPRSSRSSRATSSTGS